MTRSTFTHRNRRRRAAALACCLLCLLLFLTGCGVVVRGISTGAQDVWNSQILRQGRHGKLTKDETEWAKVAWRYFQNNYSPGTGLVGGVDGGTTASPWHMADTIAALVAARELKIIEPCDFDARFSALLQTLNTLPLFYGRLPNRLYNTQNAQMTSWGGQPGSIGWSAVELGRLLLWLKIAKTWYPEYAEYVDHLVLRWDFCDVINDCGLLFGGGKTADGQSVFVFQEGRLGYEEYAAKGFRMWGFETRLAADLEPFETAKVNDIDILYDARTSQEGGAVSAVMSLPYLLDGMELNWDRTVDNYPGIDSLHTDSTAALLAQRIYAVQERRYRREHILTARTDHRIPNAPYLVYGTIFAEGFPWNVISSDGAYHRDEALMATKAAFGLWALWKTPYTDRLMKVAECLHNPEKGWFVGRRERSGGYVRFYTIGTNAAVLEALFYKQNGKLFPGNAKPGFYEAFTEDRFNWRGKCLPPERKPCRIDMMSGVMSGGAADANVE